MFIFTGAAGHLLVDEGEFYYRVVEVFYSAGGGVGGVAHTLLPVD